MHSDGAPRATIAMRLAGSMLAIIGLGPLLWAGFRDTELGVVRLAIVDPLIIVAVCAIAAVFAPQRVSAVLVAVRERLLAPSDLLFSLLLFLWIVLVASGLSWYCFGGQSIVTDELTQAFQGRILLSGNFSAHAEGLREFFESAQTVNRDGRWFAESPIGAPLLSAIGELVRLPW